MRYIHAPEVQVLFSYQAFIPFLRSFLREPVSAPDRSHFAIPVPGKPDATLLTMPAWSVGRYFGLKVVNVFPENRDLPTIQGAYLLFDGTNGQLLCTIDGLALTLKRTASVSALASQFISREDSSLFLMIGTGNLSLELIEAHAAVRPIEQAWIWGRDFQKAKIKADNSRFPFELKAVEDKEAFLGRADIVSCATLSDDPLVEGRLLKKGGHLDLVGSFKPHSREADDAALAGAHLYVDTRKALQESGDLAIPLKSGAISPGAILNDLPGLCKTGKPIPNPANSRTVFKSVGFAAPDLAAAVYLYEKQA